MFHITLCITFFATSASWSQSLVSGSVQSAGKPLPNASVYAFSEQEMRRPSAEVTSNDAGEFTIVGLPPGRYYFDAASPKAGFPHQIFAFYISPLQSKPWISVGTNEKVVHVIIDVGIKPIRLTLNLTQIPISKIVHFKFTRPDFAGELIASGTSNSTFYVPPVPFDVSVLVDGFLPWTYSKVHRGKLVKPIADNDTTLQVILIAEKQ